MLGARFLKQMTKTLTYNRDLLANTPKSSQRATLRVPGNKQGRTMETMEDKRLAVLEKSVYIEGIRILQKQERVGYFFTLIISLALVMALFLILRMV